MIHFQLVIYNYVLQKYQVSCYRSCEEGLRFIIWDLYNTGEIESTKLHNFPMDIIENLGTRLARTSGNILKIDDTGKVSSVLKNIEKELKQKREEEKVKKDKLDKVSSNRIHRNDGKKQNGMPDKKHTIYYN